MIKYNLLYIYMSAVCKNCKFNLIKRNVRCQPGALQGSQPAATRLVNYSKEMLQNKKRHIDNMSFFILKHFFGIVYQSSCGRLTPLERSRLAASVSSNFSIKT